ncbi:MAG TPA: tRNA (adenine-N1)-methyltransferase [Caldilineaceae bacterium]|nr:tRNA (adenine-N1)-methyltransferase [Caldilineaceae bacterium]
MSIESARSTSFWFRPPTTHTQERDLVLLMVAGQKRYLTTLRRGQQLHTHLGIYEHDAIIGQPWGGTVLSSMEQPALVLEPSLTDLMTRLKRGTQIIYPKDAAYLVHRLNLRAGSRVIEAGTGSGGLTMALAWAVAPTGTVYSYEVRPETHQLARRNLERVGLLPYVELFQGSIDQGFKQQGVDALFLDVREPWRHLEAVRQALKPGGFFAGLLPTTNQVSELLAGLDAHGFTDVAVEELLLRAYKPVPERLRPDDTMIGHTGFLVSARCLPPGVDVTRWQAKERQRFRARQKMQEEIAQAAAARAVDQDPPPAGGRKYPKLPLPG